ncbi:MAG: hypothetical protein IIC60_04385 [Proteobacteria bacterium]|nr:hypothetical protein [Pseudomonadota bacterium]
MQTDVQTTGDSPVATGSSNADGVSVANTAPGQLRVIKRNGAVVAYSESKISVAITKAYLAVEGGNAAASTRIHESVAQLARQITGIFRRRMPSGGTIHIEDIQDQVELALMRTGEHKIARSYVIYRAEHNRLREQKKESEQPEHAEVTVTFADGHQGPLDTGRLQTIITEACEGLDDVSADAIYNETLKNLYPGVKMEDVRTSLVMTARTMVEQDPNYSYVTARLLMDTLRSEALGFLGITDAATQSEMHYRYAATLKPYVEKGVELGLLSPHLLEYDFSVLGEALKAERDQQFTYLGLQTLYDRYFIHSGGIRFELPQVFYMRVAMGLASNEENREQRAIEFYNLISSFDYMVSTPQLFNSGTLRPQLSSCFLTTVPDDLYGIYSAIRDNAMLSKWAGGLGNDWTPVRALGSHIKGTNGKSQGIVPFLKVVNDTAVAVNQGGKRKGAVCSYLETWHLDIEEFLELRKNTGDDRRRAVGHLGRDLYPPVQWPGVHDQDVLSQTFRARGGEPVAAGVLGQRREQGLALAFALDAQQIDDVDVAEHRVKIAGEGGVPSLGRLRQQFDLYVRERERRIADGKCLGPILEVFLFNDDRERGPYRQSLVVQLFQLADLRLAAPLKNGDGGVRAGGHVRGQLRKRYRRSDLVADNHDHQAD